LDKRVALRYVKSRKRRKRAAIISGISILGMTIMAIIAFCLMSVDRFTVTTTNEPELCLTIDENKEQLTTTLIAPPLRRAADIQYTDVVGQLDEGLGSKNTDYYFAYSFYLGGKGTEESINYNIAMSLNKYTNGLENAIRVMIIRNGVREIYAKPYEDGSAKQIYYGETKNSVPEPIGETRPFRNNKNIIVEAYEIVPGDFDKYTVVIWIDGWESADDMKGGVFSADIKFSTHSIND